MKRPNDKDVRWLYCEFLKELTIATAIVFCHRFYSRHEVDLAQNDLHTIATACIFLAGKVEETPKSLSDLLKVSVVVKHQSVENQTSLLLQDMNFVQEQRDLILRAERRLLHTLAFDFNIEHPYKYLLSTVKQMQAHNYIGEDSTRDLAQIAWNFANDSLRTTICLRHSAKACSNAVIYLATKFMGTKLHLPKDWCLTLGMDERECEKISNEILDVYERSERDVTAKISKAALQ